MSSRCSSIWVILPWVLTLILTKSGSSHVQAAPSTTLEEQQQQRIDCKLTFDAVTMDSLGQQHLECHDEEESATNKPDEQPKLQPESLRTLDSQPIYELQLVVWPTDIEDGDDFGLTTTTTAETTSSTTTTTPLAAFPLYEDQLIVFPQMDFEEENLDYFFEDLPPSTTSTSKPTSTPTSHPTVTVLQDFHLIHPNGTEEYKLVLSNGLVNYKKMYSKLIGDQLVNVQEGYNSVPIAGNPNQLQTQYFVADERGYRVYKIEHNYRQPQLDKHLHYKATQARQV